MSRQNKVNPDHYTFAGRLSPDDLARERRKQTERPAGLGRRRMRKAMPPWIANETPSRESPTGATDVDASATEKPEAQPAPPEGAVAEQPQAKPRLRDAAEVPSGATPRAAVKTRADKKTARRKLEAGKQGRTSERRGPAATRRRERPKQAGAPSTPKTRKAPRARGTAARAASPERARRPGAHRTASRGMQKATPKKGTARRLAVSKAGSKRGSPKRKAATAKKR